MWFLCIYLYTSNWKGFNTNDDLFAEVCQLDTFQ